MLLSLGPPHDPYGTVPEKYRAMYRDGPIALRANVPADKAEEATKNLRGYYAHIAALDACVARLRQAVAESGSGESDHGDMLQSQGTHHKQQPWDESLRVPFLVHYPRVLGRRRRESVTPIDAPDVMPTLLGLSGLERPESVQGVDYSPLIRGTKKDEAEPAGLLHLPASFSVVRRLGIAEYQGARMSRYTYVRSIVGPWLLYDNRTDPFQKRNLVGQAGQRDLQARLERRLAAMLKRVVPGKRYVERAKARHYREVTAAIGETKSPWGDWASTLR